MEQINWDETLIRCSSLGELMTEPKDAAEKKNGGLSKTAIGHLVKIYAWEKWGRTKDITTSAMEKGTLCEEASLDILSRAEKVVYVKNTQRFTNKHFSGLPDVAVPGETGDVKSSYETETFLPKEVEAINKSNYWQIQGYCDLTGVQSGFLAYCLVSAPMQIINQEKRTLLWKMDVATELNPDYLEAAAELERNLTFEDIDYRERVIKIEVARNDEDIELAKRRVEKARVWLAEYDEKRMKRYPH